MWGVLHTDLIVEQILYQPALMTCDYGCMKDFNIHTLIVLVFIYLFIQYICKLNVEGILYITMSFDYIITLLIIC